ncbi:hypothetical protein HPB49_021350 [Dermacentor silvarum]|uniref:Uncharacterized protein n=1 Tax=Dermacentor silvarum TaxID=543639 RepID=A0ACB8DG64_DERSI|nr:hypothetical protein HPB49_021350 [Dermacentor silvarum]
MVAKMYRQQPRRQFNAQSHHKRSRPLPEVNNQLENKGHRNGTEYAFFGEKPTSRPAKGPTPLVHVRPSHYVDVPDSLFALGQHSSAVGMRGSTSEAMNPTEYVDNGEPETQVISDVFDCGIEMTKPLEYSSFPQCSEEEGIIMDEPDSSAYYDAPLHVMNATKDHNNGQQDKAATRSTEGCNKEQLGPYDTKERLLDGTPAHLLRLRHAVSVAETLNTPQNFRGPSRYCVQLIQDLHSVHQIFGRPQSRMSSTTTTTCLGVTLTPLDDGPLCVVSATGAILTVKWFDCLCCRTPLRVSPFSFEHAIACFNQYRQVASRRRRTAKRNCNEICLIGSMAIHRTPIGDVRVHRVQRKRVMRTSPSAVTRSVTSPFFKMTVTYTASASSPFA